jgi:serine/threonine protein kinase
MLIDSEGYIKIADFGVSDVLSDGVAQSVCGTPEYRAPELWRGLQYSTPVDWWALGVMAYVMLVGEVSTHLYVILGYFSCSRRDGVGSHCAALYTVTVKVKLSLCFILTKYHGMKEYWGSVGIASRIL